MGANGWGCGRRPAAATLGEQRRERAHPVAPPFSSRRARVRTLEVRTSAAARASAAASEAAGTCSAAVSVNRLTAAAVTPGCCSSMRFTAAEQPPHFMPPTSSTSVVGGAAAGGPAGGGGEEGARGRGAEGECHTPRGVACAGARRAAWGAAWGAAVGSRRGPTCCCILGGGQLRLCKRRGHAHAAAQRQQGGCARAARPRGARAARRMVRGR